MKKCCLGFGRRGWFVGRGCKTCSEKADGEGDPRGIRANRRADKRGNRVRKTLLLLLNERDSVGRHRESDSEICCSEEMGMLLLPLKLPGCYYRKPLHKERRDLWREQG